VAAAREVVENEELLEERLGGLPCGSKRVLGRSPRARREHPRRPRALSVAASADAPPAELALRFTA
jgi:hypothetical protein